MNSFAILQKKFVQFVPDFILLVSNTKIFVFMIFHTTTHDQHTLIIYKMKQDVKMKKLTSVFLTCTFAICKEKVLKEEILFRVLFLAL